MPYTRDIDLPWAHLSGVLNPAGKGRRARTDREWTFREQLRRWGVREEPRWWKVVTRNYGEGKQECTLPSGRRIKFYDENLETKFHNPHHAPIGPYFWLGPEDAEALWLDSRATIVPWCEVIEVAPNVGKEQAYASV